LQSRVKFGTKKLSDDQGSLNLDEYSDDEEEDKAIDDVQPKP